MSVTDPRFSTVRELAELPGHWPLEISAFFRSYKELQGVETDVRDWAGAEDAWRLIAECQARFAQQRGHGSRAP